MTSDLTEADPTPDPPFRDEIWRVVEHSSDRYERAVALVTILKRLGIPEPTYGDAAAVMRWARGYTSVAVDALAAWLAAHDAEVLEGAAQAVEAKPIETPEVGRDELMDVISHEGAVCGDCATEPGDWRECEDCTRVIGRYADELTDRYDIRRRTP